MMHSPLLFHNLDVQPISLIPYEGEAMLYPGFFDAGTCRGWFTRLREETAWRHDKMRMFGKQVPLPRLTAWHGDAGSEYRYSGIQMSASPWTPVLDEIKGHIECRADALFNSVLLNLYRDGNDGVSWHSDDESELGFNPIIASVSFGQARLFKLRHKKTRKTIKSELTDGSLLIMRGSCQSAWEHEVPKTAKPVGSRINLTFRNIL